MVITGAGPGIMEAGNEGAGREKSFGVNIRLPFEAEANAHVLPDRLINFKYFFTRKLIFVKESHAFALFPGGFGTMDEAFEALTLIQTGKSPMAPIVLHRVGRNRLLGDLGGLRSRRPARQRHDHRSKISGCSPMPTMSSKPPTPSPISTSTTNPSATSTASWSCGCCGDPTTPCSSSSTTSSPTSWSPGRSIRVPASPSEMARRRCPRTRSHQLRVQPAPPRAAPPVDQQAQHAVDPARCGSAEAESGCRALAWQGNARNSGRSCCRTTRARPIPPKHRLPQVADGDAGCRLEHPRPGEPPGQHGGIGVRRHRRRRSSRGRRPQGSQARSTPSPTPGSARGREMRPGQVIEWWRHARADVVDALSRMTGSERVPWLAGDMSARSICHRPSDGDLGARARHPCRRRRRSRRHHPAAPCGVPRVGDASLRVRAAGEEYPDPIRIELRAPEYQKWIFGPEEADNVITGRGRRMVPGRGPPGRRGRYLARGHR